MLLLVIGDKYNVLKADVLSKLDVLKGNLPLRQKHPKMLKDRNKNPQ